MEILVVLAVLVAAKHGWDKAWEAWEKSRKAYMTRADRNHPHMPKGKRAGHAMRHDAGYLAAQVRQGFPHARHGFVQGWHQGRQAHYRARAGMEKARAEHAETRARLMPEISGYRRRRAAALEDIRRQEHGEGSEGTSFEPVLLTGRSKSGRPVNPITNAPEDTIAVWDEDDLNRRLAATADDPDMEVTTRPMPSPEPDDDEPDGLDSSPEDPPGESDEETSDLPDDDQEDTQLGQIEIEGDGNVSETTYQGVRQQMETAATQAEQYAAEAEQSQTVTEEHAEQARQAKEHGNTAAEEMQAMEVDAETLSAMADHLQALDDAEKRAAELNDQVTLLREAWQRVQETAQQVRSQMEASGHGALDEAHANAAGGGAQKDFYGEGG